MKDFFLAVRFLTVIPVPESLMAGSNIRQGLIFFPLVGLFIGMAGFILYSLLISFLPLGLAVTGVIWFYALISGFLHIDGFADTVDGIFSRKDKQETLKIMSDSRIGSIGAAALIMLFITKYNLIYCAKEHLVLKTLLFAPILSRFILALSCCSDAAAKDTGLGNTFLGQKLSRVEYLLLAAVPLFFAVFLFQLRGLIYIIFAATIAFVFNNYIKKRIGGLTGDTLGALTEIIETAGYLFVYIL